MCQLFAFEMPPEQQEYDTVYIIRINKEGPDGNKKREHSTWENLPPLGRDTNVPDLF